MRRGHGFVEGNLCGCAWFHDYRASLVAENAITVTVCYYGVQLQADGLKFSTHCPAAALPNACNLEASKVLVAMMRAASSRTFSLKISGCVIVAGVEEEDGW